MPHDHDLNEFMKNIEDLAYRLANPPDAVGYDQREARIKYALKEAYLAGYAQCKQDYKKNIAATEQVLIDNGIEEDEASTVLQAIGYSLLNTELYPEEEEDEEEDED
jgi:hypothetical protein